MVFFMLSRPRFRLTTSHRHHQQLIHHQSIIIDFFVESWKYHITQQNDRRGRRNCWPPLLLLLLLRCWEEGRGTVVSPIRILVLKLLEMQYTLWIELLFLPTQFLRMKLSLAFQQLLSSTPLLQTQSRVCRRGNWWSPAVHGPSPFEESMLRAKLSAKPGATTGFFFIWGIILSTGSFNGRSPLQAFVGELDWVIRLSSTILMPVISTHFSNK